MKKRREGRKEDKTVGEGREGSGKGKERRHGEG